MPTERLFVGREQELAALKAAIARPEGQLILLVGGPGFGKTELLEELNRRLDTADGFFSLLCPLNENDSSEICLPDIAADLLNTPGLTRRRLVWGAPGRREQWEKLLGAVPGVGGLLQALLKAESGRPREHFLGVLTAVADRLKHHQRLVMIFDAADQIDPSVAADWSSLLRYLPRRTTIVFGQRPEGCLARSERLLVAENAYRVPQAGLEHLSRADSDALVDAYWCGRESWLSLSPDAPQKLKDILWLKYKGYVLPLSMTLRKLPDALPSLGELVRAAARMPRDYQTILRLTYDRAADEGPHALRLLRALAVLGRPAACDSLALLYAEDGVTGEDIAAIAARDTVSRCLSPLGGGEFELFHATMGEIIVDAMSRDQRADLHKRVAELYRTKVEGA